jgi:hypothetical protein
MEVGWRWLKGKKVEEGEEVEGRKRSWRRRRYLRKIPRPDFGNRLDRAEEDVSFHV